MEINRSSDLYDFFNKYDGLLLSNQIQTLANMWALGIRSVSELTSTDEDTTTLIFTFGCGNRKYSKLFHICYNRPHHMFDFYSEINKYLDGLYAGFALLSDDRWAVDHTGLCSKAIDEIFCHRALLKDAECRTSDDMRVIYSWKAKDFLNREKDLYTLITGWSHLVPVYIHEDIMGHIVMQSLDESIKCYIQREQEKDDLIKLINEHDKSGFNRGWSVIIKIHEDLWDVCREEYS